MNTYLPHNPTPPATENRVKPANLVLVVASLLLSACQQDEQATGVIMPGPNAESWGMLDSAILAVDREPNDNGTSTVILQFDSAAVSDDEIDAAPGLICERANPTVLSSEVRSPTAEEALADGTLMLIVTCGP
jgi:hypothetical protein